MRQLAIRDTTAVLPNLDATDLEDVDSLEGRLLLSDFRLAGAEMLSLEISGQRLATGQVTGLRTGSTKLDDLRMDSVDFENVVFDHCKLDFAVFQAVTAKGPVIFRDCSLEEPVMPRFSAHVFRAFQ